MLEASLAGNYNEMGIYDGPFPPPQDYTTGRVNLEYRSFFIFQLENYTEPIPGATLVIRNEYADFPGGHRLCISSVKTSVRELKYPHTVSNNPQGLKIFRDLKNGTIFGEAEASNANPFAVRLNDAAIRALNEARNHSIAMAAYLTPLPGNDEAYMFGLGLESAVANRTVYLIFEASVSASPSASKTRSRSRSASVTSSVSSTPSVTPTASPSSSRSQSASSSSSVSSSPTSSRSRSSSPSSTPSTTSSPSSTPSVTPSPSTSPPYVRFGPVPGSVAYFGFDTPQACREFFVLMGQTGTCNTSLSSCSFAEPHVTFNNVCDIPLSVLRQVPLDTYNFYVGPSTPLGICAPPFDFHGFLCLGLDYANVVITHKNALTCFNDVAFLGSMDATVTEDCAHSFDIFVTGNQQPVPFGTLSNITNLEFLSFVVKPA